jgi:hypothetical protein
LSWPSWRFLDATKYLIARQKWFLLQALVERLRRRSSQFPSCLLEATSSLCGELSLSVSVSSRIHLCSSMYIEQRYKRVEAVFVGWVDLRIANCWDNVHAKVVQGMERRKSSPQSSFRDGVQVIVCVAELYFRFEFEQEPAGFTLKRLLLQTLTARMYWSYWG